MADAEEAARLAFGRHVGRLIRENPEFRDSLPYTAPDGNCPIVIALLTDRAGEIFTKLEQSYPDGVNLLLVDPSSADHFACVNLERRRRRPGEALVGVGVHEDSPMGMVLAFLTVHRGETVRIQLLREYAAMLRTEDPVSA